MTDIAVAVERFVGQAAAENRFSGVVLVAQGNEVRFAQSYNLACRRSGVPNRIDTRFDVASLGKMSTGVAIGQLVERGCLAFDAPISRYLPDCPSETGTRVTLHHLLTHTSGLGSIFDGGWDVASRARYRNIHDLLPYFQDHPLLLEPGTGWEYSNAGYIVLGAVIEAVTGKSYFEYVRGHIFGPASMQDTGPYSLDEDIPNLAYAASRLDPDDHEEAEPRWNNFFRHWVVSTPAGCAYSTVSDLFRFAQALRHGDLVSPRMLAMLKETTVPTGQRAGQSYAYGFYVDDVGETKTFGHAGTVPGYQAWLVIYPSLDYTVVVLGNFGHPAARDVAWFVRDRFATTSPHPVHTNNARESWHH